MRIFIAGVVCYIIIKLLLLF